MTSSVRDVATDRRFGLSAASAARRCGPVEMTGCDSRRGRRNPDDDLFVVTTAGLQPLPPGDKLCTCEVVVVSSTAGTELRPVCDDTLYDETSRVVDETK